MASAGHGYYDRASVERWLGLDTTELDTLARHHIVLALRTGDGSVVYPAWTFQNDGSPLPFLADIVRQLARGIDDPWTWALWLTAPRDDGHTAVAVLTAGGDPRPIRDDAVRDAAQWST